ncbi:hypothetical protein PUR71_08095 [Streptomyces sp. SP17BM10]|uniref:hypothetical protein n=1 Tax=Streptomyces sp. SP17BM10 TaxID=3002530 RepID=UPI002E77D54C|nr:hypothetical protein [Streptomyces sp. SP17BM10]MEE1782875.1 hypothetical protein [Streptomyces sp. SP17BM10]
MPSPDSLDSPGSPVTADALLRGVAANRAAPSDVLLRLLAPEAKPARVDLCERRPLPDDVVEAAITHPEPGVRRAIARNRYVPVEIRSRLVHDPLDFVRVALAAGPRPRHSRTVPLPDEALVALLCAQDDPDRGGILTADEIRQELGFSCQIPQAFSLRTVDHPHPRIRAHAAGSWQFLTPAQREALLADPDETVRERARREASRLDPATLDARFHRPDLSERDRRTLLWMYAASDTVAEYCFTEDPGCLPALAASPYTPAHVVGRLARHPDPALRRHVAERIDVPAELLAELAADPDPSVRTRALAHPFPRTRAQAAVIRSVLADDPAELGPIGAGAVAEPDWYLAGAVSELPSLRRAAATWPGLPAHLVERLANDPDAGVRHLLAYHHPLAPPRTVLAAFLASPAQRAYLRTLPTLPRTGLQHLLGHEDPEVRALAAADPSLDHAPVGLLTDPDERVRRAAATNPLLPPDVLDALLTDPALAEAAAANPALTAKRLHGLLDLAGLP